MQICLLKKWDTNKLRVEYNASILFSELKQSI